MSGDSIQVGEVVGSQFRILRKLGEGGMGAVYLAEQMEMDRKVVVKVLHPELTAMNPSAIERFRREAKAVAQLNHPNIVQVFVFGHADNGQLYLAMEYIEGRDLAHELKRGPLPEPRALKILDQSCAALVEAHAAGIVHRDLKPENIMLADRHGNPDYVKVLDFGIAKLHEQAGSDTPKLTQAGTVFGTPRYMSPEQVKGEKIDARSDIYALGVILYETLCGRHPFEANNTIEYLVKHVNEPVPVPSSEFADVRISPRVEQLLLTCLEKSPEDRFQSVADLQREIRAALRDFPEAARGYPSAPEPAAKGRPARAPYTPPGSKSGAPSPGVPVWVWVLAGLFIAGGLIAAVLLLGRKSPDPVQADGATKSSPKEPEALPPEAPPEASANAATREAPPAEGPAPTTSIPAGAPIDGFPVPREVTPTSSSPQGEVYETPLTPQEIMGFYRAKLHGVYAIKEALNGLLIDDPKTPYTGVTFSPYGDRFYLMLTRNPLVPTKVTGPLAPGFGVEFPPDSSLIMRSPQAVVVRSRKPFAEVCEFFMSRYGNVPNVIASKDAEAAQPYCMLAGAAAEKIEWSAISIMKDPNSPGALMISVVPRM
jgi:serine/threonine protein kinase